MSWPPPKPRNPYIWSALVAFQLTLLSLAGLALFLLYDLHVGNLHRLPTYTPAQVRDAGWNRPPLRLPIDPTLSDLPPSRRGTTERVFPSPTSPQRGGPPPTANSLHLLILTPLHDSADRLPAFFQHTLDRLTHPRVNTSLGFLESDSRDETLQVLRELCDEREDLYQDITILKKDFNLETPGGEGRHKVWAQHQRRSVMGKARSTLLMSTLSPTIDWVLWLDSDVDDVSPSLFEDLLTRGNTGVVVNAEDEDVESNDSPEERLADVVTPNIFRFKRNGKLQGYDLNNWSETPESLRRKAQLKDDVLLVEGNRGLDMRRLHLVDQRVLPNCSFAPMAGSVYPSLHGGATDCDLYDEKSPAYVGKRVELDGVGGVATLVRADAHRLGAVFPGWLADHQLETEGFGVVAKALGAHVVGLPNYVVLHASG